MSKNDGKKGWFISIVFVGFIVANYAVGHGSYMSTLVRPNHGQLLLFDDYLNDLMYTLHAVINVRTEQLPTTTLEDAISS